MKFDPKNTHVILIGYDKSVPDYMVNLDIIRNNWSFGHDLWLTTVYNGDDNKLCGGRGENTFIKLNENRGSAYGAFDEINAGLEFASNIHRDIIVIYNFDVFFITEQGFKTAIEEFLESGKQFSASVDGNELIAPDCMIFKKEFLQSQGLLPLQAKVDDLRGRIDNAEDYIQLMKENNREHLINKKIEKRGHVQFVRDDLIERYRPTDLGVDNVEEWFFFNMRKYLDGQIYKKGKPMLKEFSGIDNSKFAYQVQSSHKSMNDSVNELLLKYIWHDMKRDGLPRLEWTERLTLLHSHDYNLKKELLKKYNITNGPVIKQFLEIK